MDSLAEIVAGSPKIGHKLSLYEALKLFETVSSQESVEHLENFLVFQVLRAVEMEILGSDTLVDIALHPGIYKGSERKIIQRHLDALLGEAPLSLVDHFQKLVMSGVAGSSTKQSIKPHEQSVFRQTRKEARQLRCFCCGYHFTRADLGPDRLELATELDFELAENKLSRRIRDPWKPNSESQLELDHWIPEAGLGPTNAGNLRTLCKFCNTRKFIWRWPAEALSQTVAAALLTLGDSNSGRGHRAATHAVFFSIATAGKCGVCGALPQTTELTLGVKNRMKQVTVPWKLRTVCYGCYDPADPGL